MNKDENKIMKIICDQLRELKRLANSWLSWRPLITSPQMFKPFPYQIGGI